MTTPEIAGAAKLASALDLRAVSFDALEGRAVPPRRTVATMGWTLHPIDVKWEREGDVVRVFIPFRIDVTEATPEEAVLFALYVVVRSEYAVLPETREMVSDALVDDFAGISGVMHAWPYLRAEVQTLTTKLGMPVPLVLPNIVATQLPDSVEVLRIAPKRGKKGSGARKGGRREGADAEA